MKNKSNEKRGAVFAGASHAFTRTELCFALAGVALVAAVITPALASNRGSSERALCFNNLRRVGMAVNEFKSAHEGLVPWRTLTSDGGTMPTLGMTKPGAAWYEFSILSNALPNPRVLTCPSDSGVRVATEFVGTPTSYTSVGMRSAATSYTIALDVASDNPDSWISGDRNLRPDAFGGTTCSSRVMSAASVNIPATTSQVRWTNAVHGPEFGHLLLNDGSVVFTDTPTARALITNHEDLNGSTHFLPAR